VLAPGSFLSARVDVASVEWHLDSLDRFAGYTFVGAQIDLGVGRMRFDAGQARAAAAFFADGTRERGRVSVVEADDAHEYNHTTLKDLCNECFSITARTSSITNNKITVLGQNHAKANSSFFVLKAPIE
jgi:hypothetical protein